MAERTDLGRNLRELEDKAKDLADWHVHYRNHPAAFVGAAVGAGVLLGTLLGGRRNGVSEHDYYPVEAPVPREHSQTWRRETARFSGQVRSTWDHIADALLAVAAAKAVHFVERAVPGFKDHYRGDGSSNYARERM